MLRKEAKKVFIAEIVRGNFTKEDDKTYVISPFGEKIFRASIVGTIIDKFEFENYCALAIDDGSEVIRVKSFGEPDLSSFENGDIVVAIGKIREYNNEIYLNAEIVRKISFKEEIFEKLRVLKRLLKMKKIIDEIKSISEKFDRIFAIEYAKEKYGLNEEIVEQFLIPKEIDYSEKIFETIKNLDKGEGVGIDQIFKVSALPEKIVEDAISKLLEEGKLFEPKPGRFKCV